MNVPKKVIDYYRLLSTADNTKHPVNFVKPNVILTDTEITIYFKPKNDDLAMNTIIGGGGGNRKKIIIY